MDLQNELIVNDDLCIESSSSSSSSLSSLSILKVGEVKSLDEMGPIIINADGTTTRIANWSAMNQQEKDTAIRLISARNKKRIEVLKQQQSNSNDNDNSRSSSS